MDNVVSHDPDGALPAREPWDGLLAAAGPRDHIVQLYQDQQFLNRAVCRFAAGAIANGEGVILVPTAPHWEAFRPRLENIGAGVRELLRLGPARSGSNRLARHSEAARQEANRPANA